MKEQKGIKQIKNIKEIAGITVFIVLMMILFVYAALSSKSTAYVDVKEALLEELTNSQNEFLNALENMRISGVTAARMLEKNTNDKYGWDEVAETIRQTTDAYKVEIVDKTGLGFQHDGTLSQVVPEQFTEDMGEILYTYWEDGFAEPGVIGCVPMFKNEKTTGMIYIYLSEKYLAKKMVDKSIRSHGDYYIVGADGSYYIQSESNHKFGKGENFFTELKEAKSLESDMTTEKAIEELMTLNKDLAVGVSVDGKDELILAKKLGIEDWYIVGVMNYDYIDKYMKDENHNITSLITSLTILTISFLLVVMYYLLITKEREKVLESKSETDLLTGLYNKIATENKIKKCLEEEADKPGMFVHLDIDDFKNINDTMGHAFGDEVLKMVGTRMKEEFRTSDILGRTGGDEFMLYLKNMKSPVEAHNAMERLERIFSDFTMGDYVRYNVTASIGVSLYPDHGKTYEDLYKTSDIALYRAKKQGKNCLVKYEE